jgi:PAS domain S-box-containing protein
LNYNAFFCAPEELAVTKFLLAMSLLMILAAAPAHANQRVRVAVFDNPPLISYDDREHRATGIFMDVLRYTAAREGWDVEYVPGEPAQGLERLARGEVDLIPAVPHSRAREQRLSFTRETLATSWARIYVRPGSRIRTIRDLAARNVAVLKGSLLQEQLLRGTADAGSPANLQEFPTFAPAFRAVEDGRADAVLANRFTGAVYARETGLEPTPVVLAPYGFRFATRPDARLERLLEALDRNLLLLKTDSESLYYRDLQELEDGAREFFVPTWIYPAAGAAVVVLALAFGWVLTARRAASRMARGEAQLLCAHRQLQLAHEELDRISANSPDLIAVFDANFVVRRVNLAAERLLGTPPEMQIGRSALDWVPVERRHASRLVLERVRAGACLQGHSSQVLRADGTVVPFLWSLAWSEENQELYAIGHDDTERHELISDLSRRTTQLQVVNAGLQTFAQSVSHDLRAPVAAVVGFVGKVLRDDGACLQERSRELLARAHSAGERMDAIISSLLRLARVTEGGIHRRDCDITAACHDIMTGLCSKEPWRAVTVDIQHGMRAHADRDLLRHVLENLLSNAWKYSARAAHAHIAVGCDQQDSPDPTFFVRDDGAGFDMAYADRLFLPFGRLHSEKEFDGVGIGLCVAQRVVAAHGGRLWAEAAPGAGAVFRFSLGEPLLTLDRPGEEARPSRHVPSEADLIIAPAARD